MFLLVPWCLRQPKRPLQVAALSHSSVTLLSAVFDDVIGVSVECLGGLLPPPPRSSYGFEAMEKLGKVTSQEEIAAKDSKKLARKGPQKAFSTLETPQKKQFFQNSSSKKQFYRGLDVSTRLRARSFEVPFFHTEIFPNSSHLTDEMRDAT